MIILTESGGQQDIYFDEVIEEVRGRLIPAEVVPFILTSKGGQKFVGFALHSEKRHFTVLGEADLSLFWLPDRRQPFQLYNADGGLQLS